MGFDYDDANRRTKTTLSNSVEIDYGYDEANQLRSISYKRSANRQDPRQFGVKRQ